MGNKESKETQVEQKEVIVTNEKTGATGVYLEKKNIPNFKIVLIGDPSVGKTAIFTRYIRNSFVRDYRPTKKVVLENVVKTVNLPAKAVSCVTLWDIPGSEDMDLRSSYYRNVDAAVVVVDMNDPDSIELAGAWKQDFINKATKAKLVVDTLPNGIKITKLEEQPCNPAKIPVMLLGNKFDIVEEELKEQRLKRTLEKNLLKNESAEERLDRNFKNMKRQLGEIDEDEEEKPETNPDDDNRAFPVQRAPKDTDDRPECVKLLEEVEAEHGFVGSVMVSAKDGDGSADAALQSLVRYLLEKHYGKRKPKEKPPPPKEVKADKEDYKPLVETGREEFDTLFKRCYNPLKKAGDYTSYYDLVLKRFKQSCADHGFLDHGKPSLEDCILGIRNVLKTLGRMDLKIEDWEDFVNLVYNIDSRVKIPDEVNVSLNVFNTEYALVCNSILRDCPIIIGLLQKFDRKIADKSKDIEHIMKGKNEKAVSRIVSIFEQNRARIAFAKAQIEQCMKDVENAKLKVKASLMW